MKSTKQAIENMEFVRRLLEQKQPGFAASLQFAASLVETSLERTDGRTDPAVRDGGPRSLPADDSAVPGSPARQRRTGSPHAVKVRLGPQGRRTRGIFNLLADVAGDPVLAVPLRDARGHISDLMVTVGPAANGIILSSRRRLLALIRAGEADDVAREMEQHLGGPVLDAAPVQQLSTDRHRYLTRLILRTWKLVNSRQGHSAAVLT